MIPRTPYLTSLAALILASTISPVSATTQNGLTTSDPSKVSPGGCQVESWYAHNGGARAFLSMPVCSASDKPTIGGQLGTLPASLQGGWNVGASAKFADPRWQDGNVRWGLKVSTSMQGIGLAHTASLLGLASMELPLDMQLRLNMGPKLGGANHEVTKQLNAALTWPLDDRLSLTSETLSSGGSPTQQSVGTSLWLMPGRMALDLNAGRSLTGDADPNYSLRFQWYWGDRKPIP